LTAEDVTDIPASFVADPFLVEDNSRWYLFFEIMNASTKHGDIGLAISEDGLNWEYKQTVLDEPFHLSYPYVFAWESQHFMIPESQAADSVRLYRAENFPLQWSFVTALLQGEYEDPSIFRHKDNWWLFVGTDDGSTLRLYHADDLTGPWAEHPKSPIIADDANVARPGGRVLVSDERLFRFAQDGVPTYGNQLRVFEITKLSITDYAEKELPQSPILEASGRGWNADGMHHADPHPRGDGGWIASVDGYKESIVFGFGY
jgi:hypothetical protein